MLLSKRDRETEEALTLPKEKVKSRSQTYEMFNQIPLDKFGSPQDIANCAAFLCSDLSNYITGETIHVNGGMYFS